MEMAKQPGRPWLLTVLLLAALIPAAILAFYKSVAGGVTFSGLPMTVIVYVHAASMMLWLGMLTTQAWLASTGKLTWHRWLGRTSYILAPAIVLLFGMTITELRAQNNVPVDVAEAQIEIFNWPVVIAFATCWGLAIVYRRETPIHKRFMISTAFVIGNAIIVRILLSWFGWLPIMSSLDNVILISGGLLLLPLLGLILADHNPSPFSVPAGFLACIMIGYFTFAQTGPWLNFVNWYSALANG